MTTETTLPRLLSPAELSEYLRVPIRTLEGWRNGVDGPPYKQYHRQVWYPENALIEWLEARKTGK